MKALFVSTFILTLSLSARADYSLSGRTGPVVCDGKGVHVTLDSARKNLSVKFDEDPRVFTDAIVETDSDGDTFFSYSIANDDLVLTLDDRGDTLDQRQAEDTETFDLTCI